MDFLTHHAHFDDRLERWTFNQDHRRGGLWLYRQARRYLVPFDVESDEGYKNRLERSPGLYENLVEASLQVYSSQLWRREPDRDLPPSLSAVLKDVDLNGTDASAFFQQATENADLFGIYYTLVDAPRIDPGTTEDQVAKKRLRPFFEHIEPHQLVDWEVETNDTERRGRLNYAVIEDCVCRGKGPFQKGEDVRRLRVFTRDTWEIWENSKGDSKDFAPVAAGTNFIGEVPIAIWYSRRKEPMVGETIFDDVSAKSNALWNRSSVRDESFYFQGFAQLFIFSDNTSLGKLKLGEARAIKLGQSDSADYKAPPANVFEAYKAYVREMIDSVADLVFVRSTRQLPTAAPTSAETRETDRQEFLALLAKKAQGFEESEREAWRLAALLAGETPDAAEKIEIKYNRQFRSQEADATEWSLRLQGHVASRVEWRMALHPEETKEDAEKAIEEIDKDIEERTPIALQAANDKRDMVKALLAGQDLGANRSADAQADTDEAKAAEDAVAPRKPEGSGAAGRPSNGAPFQ